MVYTINVIKNIVNKFLILVLILCLSFGFFITTTSSVKGFILAKSATWAQIKNSNTYLLKSAELESSTLNRWCYLEESYFVKILSHYNDYYYNVEYNGITGYVLKTEVTPVNETPVSPYPSNVSFSTGKTNCYLRSAPQSKTLTNNTLCVIPANTKNLKFIGKIIGEEAVDFKGSVWFLTSYNGIIGYVYSGYATNITEIMPNLEKVSALTETNISKINPLSNTECLIIITLTLLPCLLILFLLYSPKKAKKTNLHSTITTQNKIKNKPEYYDENL